MYQGGCGQTCRGADSDVGGVVGARVYTFGGHYDGRHRAHGAAHGHTAATAVLNATPAAVCPDGKDEESGRS